MSKRFNAILTVAWLGALVSYAAPQVTLLKQVGPDPALAANNSNDGLLQVYTARERAPIDINAEVFFCNNDFGKNEFLQGTAHSGYSIFDHDGRLVQRVRNTTGMNDPNPTPVKLSPGVYRIKAEAADYSNVTLSVMIPVCVEPGLTTALHLDGKCNPSMIEGNEAVRLPNGSFVGWHCPGSDDGKFAAITTK
jgi:hypothetical protein